MGAWWPATHHIGTTPFRDILIEHHVGGRWFELNDNGEECQWGHVLAWEPPHRVVISWHVGPDWKHNPSLDHASEVTVTFTKESAESTRVELLHSRLERHQGDFVKLGNELDSPGGWTAVLLAFQHSAEDLKS